MSKVLALAAMVALAGCDSPTGPKPAHFSVIGGDEQVAQVNTVLPIPFSVIVLDRTGRPMANTTIKWEITGGGGSLSAAETKTDANGTAQVTYTTGATAGEALINCTLEGFGVITFTVTVTT
jgi:hypothetical protein